MEGGAGVKVFLCLDSTLCYNSDGDCHGQPVAATVWVLESIPLYSIAASTIIIVENPESLVEYLANSCSYATVYSADPAADVKLIDGQL